MKFNFRLFKNGVMTAAAVAAVVISQVAWLSQHASAAPTGLPSGFTATTLINWGFTAPTSVRVAPDGRVFVVDLTGYIKIFKNNGWNAANFGTVAVDASGDRGLLGAVFDTDFAHNPYLYVYYVGTDDKARIGRFDATTDVGANFTVLYTSPDVSGFQHAGGSITMGNDRKIFFGIGDSGTPANGQDLTKANGKIHRINPDGTVPSDNPFLGQAGVDPTNYTLGMRNPFRMTTDKQTGTIYEGDVGESTWEEVNQIKSGKNYGWPAQEGPCQIATCPYEEPIYWYSHQSTNSNNTNDSAIMAGPVYRGNAYPASYKGKMFVSDYVQGFLRTIDPTIASSNFTQFSSGNGAVVDMDVGPDGLLYFVTITSPTLYRVDYSSGSVNQPPVAQAGADVTTGPAPLTVHFNSTGSSDPEGQPLGYAWDFGDGTTSTQANPTKTYNTTGQFTVRLNVNDGVNTTPAAALTIKVGTPPIVTITSPTSAFKYNGGTTVTYSATAKDSNNNPIPDANLKTTIILHHSDHTHPYLGPFTGGSGSFTTPTTGELSPDVWLHLTVDATDSNGIVGSQSVDIQPNKATITVNTSPAGLNVVLDGSNHVIPPTVQGVVGMQRQIAAPSPQTFNGVQYVFDHWSDGGAQDHTFNFPATDSTYTAFYVPASGGGTQMTNIAPNPSFETLGTNGLPSSWTASRWGTNDATFTSSTDAHTGSRSARLQTTSYTNGEIRLYHAPVNVAPSTVHSVQYFYKSDVQTKAVADVTLTDNTHKYIWLGINQPSAGWREQDWALTTPAGAKNVVVNLYLVTAGFLQVDDFALLAPNGSTPTDAPAITISASPASITNGGNSTLNWSVSGTTPTCTASGAWSGSQPVSGSLSVSPTATSTYTLSCTNSAGSDTKSATVTVGSSVPASGNLVLNPSFEQLDSSNKPTSWNTAKWGTNNAIFSVINGSAATGNNNVRAEITTFSSGEAQWYFAPVTVSPSTLYTFGLTEKSSGPNKILADITLTDNTHQYIWLGTLTSSSSWTNVTKTLTTPANAKSLTVGTYLTGSGFFEIDDVSLTPPATPPVVTLGASSTTITAGQSTTLNWSATGSPACTASGGWSGSQPASGSLSVSPTATTTYTLLCANSAGSDTKSVTITVNPVTPPPATNLVANPSLLDAPIGATIPTSWYQGMWGTNTTAFSYDTTGRTDARSISITMSNYVSGDAKWFFEPAAVAGNTSYTFSDWYKATTNTELVVEYTLSDATKSYVWLGSFPPASSWTQLSQTITTPASATKVTVYHVIKSNGTLQLDDYSLTQN